MIPMKRIAENGAIACGDYAAQKSTDRCEKEVKVYCLERVKKRIYLSDLFYGKRRVFLFQKLCIRIFWKTEYLKRILSQPILEREKKELACYQIKPVHILAPRSIQYENCEVTSVCPECGNTRLEKKGIRKYYEGAYIDMDKIDFIDDINASKGVL